jgi:hypothetical protein
VIVTLPETVTVQFAPDTEVQPDHELKLLLLAVAGAPKIIVVPALSVTENVVVPVASKAVAALPYEMATPLAGFELATVML